MKYFPGEQPWGCDMHLSCFIWIYDNLQNTNVYKADLQRNSRIAHQRHWENLRKEYVIRLKQKEQKCSFHVKKEDMLLAQNAHVTNCQYLSKAGEGQPFQLLHWGAQMLHHTDCFSGTAGSHGLSTLSLYLGLF